MESIHEAIDVLAKRTPDEIRDFLLFVNCKGLPRNPCVCPIANYIYKFTNESVAVNYFQIATSERSVVIKTPENIGKFIEAFDSDEYPELDTQCSA